MTLADTPLADLQAAMRAVVDRVRADARQIDLQVTLGIDHDFSGAGGDLPAAARVVGTIGGHTFASGFDKGLESGCARVASAFQDEVVALRGAPWPEILDGSGDSLGVLDVALDPVGIAHWQHGGKPVCAVGHLESTSRAHGWQVR